MSNPVNTRLVIGPNASMSVRMAWGFMGAVAGVSLAIGGFFAWRGLWPILPFAGLELAAVGAALAVSLRRNRYREVLSFEAGRIRIESGELGRGPSLQVELQRGPTRVLVEPGPHRTSPTRLVLACGGQRVEVGHCLTDAERERLAWRLRQLIHPGWRDAPTQKPEAVPTEFLR